MEYHIVLDTWPAHNAATIAEALGYRIGMLWACMDHAPTGAASYMSAALISASKALGAGDKTACYGYVRDAHNALADGGITFERKSDDTYWAWK